jgi:hypothetical protein
MCFLQSIEITVPCSIHTSISVVELLSVRLPDGRPATNDRRPDGLFADITTTVTAAFLAFYAAAMWRLCLRTCVNRVRVISVVCEVILLHDFLKVNLRSMIATVKL